MPSRGLSQQKNLCRTGADETKPPSGRDEKPFRAIILLVESKMNWNWNWRRDGESKRTRPCSTYPIGAVSGWVFESAI